MSNTVLYDLVIIGGGPAGVAAGVYASRKRIKTAFVAETFGGQSIVSDGIENWIGTVKISGQDLAKSLEQHLKAYAGEYVEIFEGFRAEAVQNISVQDNTSNTPNSPIFEVTIKDHGQTPRVLQTKTVLIATGSKRRKLEVKGADMFEHKGVTYCATCDEPMFADQDVAVIGGGNAAFESAAQLAQYCKSVTLFNRGSSYRADAVTVEKVLSKDNVTSIQNVELLEVQGSQFVEKLVYKIKPDQTEHENETTTETKEILVSGIFVEIGQIPNTDNFKNIVEIDSFGKIVTNPKNQQTSTAGIWAAGDCTDCLYHQNNIAAGDAVKALEDIFVSLSKR